MEKEFYTDEFEQLIREKADQFRMYPSKRVWHSIYNNLHPSRRWPSVVMSLLLLTSLMLIGYLNTGDNTINRQINTSPLTKTENEINNTNKAESKKQVSTYTKTQQQRVESYDHAFDDVITNETDFYAYTIVKSNRPKYFYATAPVTDEITVAAKDNGENNGKDLIQDVDTYIKSNKLFTDIAATPKKNKTNSTRSTAKNNNTDLLTDDNSVEDLNTSQTDNNHAKPGTVNNGKAGVNEVAGDKNAVARINAVEQKKLLTNEEKAWIENYALLSKPAKNKWKNNLAFQFYATPAVNYRKLSTKSKGSTTPFATMGDINNAISQKPGFGFETGLGVNYSIAKRLRLKAGFQFNYTNYNIAADQTNHPVVTTILLVDPNTGYSYSASRTSTTANAYNSTPLQPVTLHNRTYQISVPVGFAYKLSTEKNVDWFAGASVQPTYVFGGNAHIISSDLKSYVSDPSSIRTWNLNLGFETYMNFKLGTYQLQVGPQVRYQVYSTYRKNVALIEKPYAVGLKFGLTKGF
ncbi:MAG: outer membrane beta-barrel protein [Ferruginibacter sp.]